MKHLFIVNPAAGKGRGIDKLILEIDDVSRKQGVDTEVYVTTCVGDAEYYTRTCCSKNDWGGALRIYACGGDGTLNEVLNGMTGFPNVEAACVPIGSGNDFIRNMGGGDPLDIEAQIKGTSRLVDLLRYTEIEEGKPKIRYCINMFNIGFDSDVAFRVGELKRIPFLTGSMAYIFGTFVSLAQKESVKLKIIFDNGTVREGRILQIDIGNGSYYGGGIKAVPKADINDGLMDVSIVKDVSLLRFLRLFPKYKKGTHLTVKNIEDIVNYTQCKSISIEPASNKMRICTDGEISETGPIQIEIIPSAIRFNVPAPIQSEVKKR